MELVFLCVLFAPIIYYACRQKKWYLYLVLAFVGILPEQFAIKVHESLPLISCTRILIMLLFAYWGWEKLKTKSFYLPKSLLIYLGVHILVSIVNFPSGADELKRIFSLVFERVLLAIMIADMIKTREEFDIGVDFVIAGSAVLAVIGIIQTIFEFDIASALHLLETMSSITLSRRMNLVRAYGTFNAIIYGCYCAFMMIPITYRLVRTQKLKYSVAMALNVVALFSTFSRSAWMAIAAVFLVLLLVYRWKLIRKLLPSVGFAVLLCAVLCIVQPKFGSAMVETGKSTINTVLSALPERFLAKVDENGSTVGHTEQSSSSAGHTEQNSSSAGHTEQNTAHKNPGTESEENEGNSNGVGFELSSEFGLNGEDPSYSRMAQWTAVDYMARQGHLLFGYGYGALPEGKLHFFFDRWEAKWMPTSFLDVGMVALITESGLVGAIASFSLLCYIMVEAIRRRTRKKQLDPYKVAIYMIPLFLLLNFLAAFLQTGILWLFVGLFYAYRKLDTNHCLKEEEPSCQPEMPAPEQSQTGAEQADA